MAESERIRSKRQARLPSITEQEGIKARQQRVLYLWDLRLIWEVAVHFENTMPQQILRAS
jgi:hypothetical protein